MRKIFFKASILCLVLLISIYSPSNSCIELYDEWNDCLSDPDCRLIDKQVIYWELVAGGCYLPPVY